MDKEIKKFEEFVAEAGAQVLPITNEWELLRFKCVQGTGIIYQDKRGSWTNVGAAIQAWECFKSGKVWHAVKIDKRTKLSIQMDKIINRDGNKCFYCGEEFGEFNKDKLLNPSLEHLLSIADGGSNHLKNLVLAHVKCNQMAGSMAIIEKIFLREKLRCKV